MRVNLEERSEAMSLISRYARSTDASKTSAVLGCFTDDVSLSFEGGNIVITGRADAETFYRGVHAVKRVPSSHLLSNYGFERAGSAIVVHCSAIACSCSKPGFVTLKGIDYVFTCVREGAELRIRHLQNSSTWECHAPGGLSPNRSATGDRWNAVHPPVGDEGSDQRPELP
jgi:hypothetical protein